MDSCWAKCSRRKNFVTSREKNNSFTEREKSRAGSATVRKRSGSCTVPGLSNGSCARNLPQTFGIHPSATEWFGCIWIDFEFRVLFIEIIWWEPSIWCGPTKLAFGKSTSDKMLHYRRHSSGARRRVQRQLHAAGCCSRPLHNIHILLLRCWRSDLFCDWIFLYTVYTHCACRKRQIDNNPKIALPVSQTERRSITIHRRTIRTWTTNWRTRYSGIPATRPRICQSNYSNSFYQAKSHRRNSAFGRSVDFAAHRMHPLCVRVHAAPFFFSSNRTSLHSPDEPISSGETMA